MRKGVQLHQAPARARARSVRRGQAHGMAATMPRGRGARQRACCQHAAVCWDALHRTCLHSQAVLSVWNSPATHAIAAGHCCPSASTAATESAEPCPHCVLESPLGQSPACVTGGLCEITGFAWDERNEHAGRRRAGTHPWWGRPPSRGRRSTAGKTCSRQLKSCAACRHARGVSLEGLCPFSL
jgi:hypothetical protein